MDWETLFLADWPVKLVSVILIIAAWIDGKELRVPNWITYPMVFSGIVYNTYINGWDGMGFATWGMVVGLLTLLPLYSVGGMGAGDVKLMAGIGAWLGGMITFWAFIVTVFVGAAIAVGMVLYKRSLDKHYSQMLLIFFEWINIKDPRRLGEIAKDRKPTMFLLPYGIPICIGSIAYFFFAGLVQM